MAKNMLYCVESTKGDEAMDTAAPTEEALEATPETTQEAPAPEQHQNLAAPSPENVPCDPPVPEEP